jgi:hypothetical protein
MGRYDPVATLISLLPRFELAATMLLLDAQVTAPHGQEEDVKAR